MSVEVKVPPLGESIVEATVGRWLKAPGDSVTSGDALVELETDKVNMEVSAPEAGVLQSITTSEGETVVVGDVLAVIADGAGAGASGSEQSTSSGHAEVPATEVSRKAAGPNENGARATPVARRMAEEHNIELSAVTGSGPGGRVTKEDVEGYLHGPDAAGPAPTSAGGLAEQSQFAAAEPPANGRPEERIRMSRLRQTIARRLVEAQHTAAMLTTFNEVDMTAIMDVRSRKREAFKERYGVGLGFMSFFTKAVVGALKAQPRLNAEIDGDEIILKYFYDVGIAVSTENGLVVPVVRDADRLTFAEIERQVADLAERARNRTLGVEELQGGTFTITNGGVFGSLLSTPILNYPQVGILGMHKIQQRPVAVDGEVVIRPMMYVALSYDHRIVDGSEAVRFLVRVKEMLEDPEALLLEG
jgi:2-oxoglutarate dehydrogenase E2 component (dihydrolipoamide succinyltransferase)